jgi:hypothetical protein
MRRDAGALDAVHMDGDRISRAGITEPVDLVKPGASKATIAGLAHLGAARFRGGCGSVEPVDGFLERTLIDRVGAPRIMRVRRAELTRTPNDRDDRKPPGGIAVEDMARVATAFSARASAAARRSAALMRSFMVSGGSRHAAPTSAASTVIAVPGCLSAVAASTGEKDGKATVTR